MDRFSVYLFSITVFILAFVSSKDEEFNGFIALEQMCNTVTDMPLGKEGRSE